MGRKLYAKGEGFNPTTGIDDVEGLREELDALKGGSGGGGGDTTAIERRLTTAEGEIDALQGDVAEQSKEIAAVGAKVNTLQGPDTGKSVRTIAAEETAKIVGEAPANYDTLKEIADYISSDAEGAAELRNKVNKNATDIADLQELTEAIVKVNAQQDTALGTKASKVEAQGYATTAKNEAIAAAAADAQEKADAAEGNANDYTDTEVEKLATVAPIAAGGIVKLTFGWTVSALISFNATQAAAKDLFYYATYGTGTSIRTQYNFLHQSGLLKIYIDESNTGTILYLHNTTQAGTMSVNNLIPSTVSIEEVSAIPENATLIGDEKTLATLTDVRTRLGKTEKAADSAKSDNASALIPKSTTVTSVTNTSLTYHLVLADDTGSLPRGDNANALITIPTLNGNLKYLHQLGFTSNGLFHRKFYNKDVDSATPWSQIAFTDSTVANANSAATSSSLTVNGITSDVTYGTTAGIIQNTADNPTGYWWNKFRILHNNSKGYFTELAMPFKFSSGLYYRAMETGVLSEWYKIPFASEIPTLALQGKTGFIPYSSPNATPVGWYRIGVTTRTSQQGWAFRMMLRRHFNNNATESYIIDASIGYASGAASNVYFTQIAGGIYNSRLIDKVRVTVASNSKSYIDLHISADCKNNLEYFLDGDAEAYAEGIIVTEETAATYEFSTVNGLAASHDITAPKFIGALQGNADSATKLTNSRKLWGQAFDGTAAVNGNLILYNADDINNGNASSAKLVFGGSGEYRGPYIEAVAGGGWGMKTLVFYQYNTQEWPGDYSKHYAAMVLDIHGRLGIGITSPRELLEVAGGIKQTISTSTGNIESFIIRTTDLDTNYGLTTFRIKTTASSAESDNYYTDIMAFNAKNKNVGIGTTSPTEKLEVAGNIKASGMLTTGGDAQVGGAIDVEGGITSRGDIDASGNNIKGNLDGTITKNEVASGVTLQVIGLSKTATSKSVPYIAPIEITDNNMVVAGTMTATATYHSSDERLKTFEGDVDVDLEKLKALPKKYFHWKADTDGKRQIGTSAQAVEELFPELVSTDAEDCKSVNYANLSIVALAAVDKLAEQNAELERRLAKIEKLLNIE